MGRNFGLGNRDMGLAGKNALRAAADRGDMSTATLHTVAERWRQFVSYARERGIKKMERIDRDTVVDYGRGLADAVRSGEMSASRAQVLVSAVNTVMSLATRWESVGPVRDAGIPQRSAIRDTPPPDRDSYQRAVDALRESGNERGAAVVELAREFGLRSKEASLIDARAALDQARERSAISVQIGTKGGREREIELSHPERQIAALERAAAVQGDGRSLIPAGSNWREWQQNGLREIRDVVREYTGGGLHDLRAAYAVERYQDLTGTPAPVVGGGGVTCDRELDREARLMISEELGHGRIDVVAEYIGGRR
jgi:hypothetical protein